MEEETVFYYHTQIFLNMRSRWTVAFAPSEQTYLHSCQQNQVDLPSFLTKKTFTVTKNVNKDNKLEVRNNADNENDKTNDNGFYGMAI